MTLGTFARNDPEPDVDPAFDLQPVGARAQDSHNLASDPGTVDIHRRDCRAHVAGQAKIAETGDGELIRDPDSGRVGLDDQPLGDPVRTADDDIGLLGQVCQRAEAKPSLAEMAGNVDVEPGGLGPGGLGADEPEEVVGQIDIAKLAALK